MPSSLDRRLARRAAVAAPSFLESLEPRLVLAAPYDFFAAGIRFDDGPRVFMSEGVLAEDDTITGSTTFVDYMGVQSTAPIDWTSLTRGDDGAFTFGTRPGFTPYASQFGTQFLFEERRFVGSFVGNGPDGELRDFAVLGQRESIAPPATFLNLDLSMTRLTDSGTVETFELLISTNLEGTTARFLYRLPSGDIFVDKTVASRSPGRLEFDTGEVLLFTQHANFMLTPAFLIDFDAADDIVGIAIGRNGGYLNNTEGDAGRFRSAILVDGPVAAQFLGVDPGALTPGRPVAANVVIELHFWSNTDAESLPNTFRIYRQSEWDAGMRTPINQGTWTYSTIPDAGGFPALRVIRLLDDSGAVMRLRESAPRVLAFDDVQSQGVNESITGSGAAVSHRFLGGVQEVLVDVDADGNPIAYMQFGSNAADSQLYSINLVAEVGGEPVAGSIVTWVTHPNAGRDRYIAGLSSAGHIQLWRLNPDTVSWSYVDLTSALEGARPIASDLFHTGSMTEAVIDSVQRVTPTARFQTLAGYDADGNFVAYRYLDTHDFSLMHASRWLFVDVEANGVGGAGFVPDAVAGFSGWNTDWGGIHFAGVDAGGELWSVWWAPDLEQWQVSSLSQAAGTPVLAAARPSVTITDWHTFHVVATDPQGHVIITWWARDPDEWLSYDVTADLAGPSVQIGTVSASFTRLLSNINIGALDENGRAVVYWWRPGAEWQVNDISGVHALNTIPRSNLLFTWARYSDNVMGIGEQEVTQSFVGKNDAGNFVRLIWHYRGSDAWLLEDLTALSTPYVVM